MGTLHAYRLAYQDNRTDNPDLAYPVGDDYFFSLDTKTLKRVSYWVRESAKPTVTVTLVTDEIISADTLEQNFFNPAAYGLVLAPRTPQLPDPRPTITIGESGCFTVDKQDFTVTRVANDYQDAKAKGFNLP